MSAEDFVDMFADEITVEPYASQDNYGAASYGEAKAIRARVEMGPKVVVNANGEEVVSSARVYVGAAVGVRDRITLPEDAPMRQPPIIRVDPVRDENGIHHWEIYT